MSIKKEKIPTRKELEKEISAFLTKKFGNSVKIVSPIVMPQEIREEKQEFASKKPYKIDFNILPEELVSYLDEYIIKQDNAKKILSTKICTHFNRITSLI